MKTILKINTERVMMKKLAAVFLSCLMLLSVAAFSQTKKGGETKASRKGDDEKGKAVFGDKNCGVCHWTDKADKRIGPGFKGLFKREKMWDDKPMTEANVREMIQKGGGKMTGFDDITAKEMDDLIAYLKTL